MTDPNLFIQAETRGLMLPMIKSWMEQFLVILQPHVQPEDPDDWGIRMEVDLVLLLCWNFGNRNKLNIVVDGFFKTGSFIGQVLKCLIQFVQNFPSLTEAEFSGKLISLVNYMSFADL